MERNNMIIYRSFYEAIIELTPEDQIQVWKAIYELGLYGLETKLSGIPKTIFTLIKPQINANIKRYNNGKIPKTKQIESKPEAESKQQESKSEANKNKNKNINNNIDNIEIRKTNFYKYLSDFKNQYPKEMLKEFFEYWSEHGLNDRKMRFEKEKTFGVSRRLKTWFNNSGDKYSDPGSDKLVAHIKKQINESGKRN